MPGKATKPYSQEAKTSELVFRTSHESEKV